MDTRWAHAIVREVSYHIDQVESLDDSLVHNADHSGSQSQDPSFRASFLCTRHSSSRHVGLLGRRKHKGCCKRKNFA